MPAAMPAAETSPRITPERHPALFFHVMGGKSIIPLLRLNGLFGLGRLRGFCLFHGLAFRNLAGIHNPLEIFLHGFPAIWAERPTFILYLP